MADSKLKGMRELNEDEINVMNNIADLGNQFGELIDKLEHKPLYVFEASEIELNVYPDSRWMAIGKSHLQQGIMCLKRAIGKPDNF